MHERVRSALIECKEAALDGLPLSKLLIVLKTSTLAQAVLPARNDEAHYRDH
jgi:hypothetical protein